MIDALPRAKVLRWLTSLILLISAAATWVALRDGTLAGQVLKSAGVVGIVLNGGILLLSWRPAFLWIYAKAHGDLWCFPLLDGEWEAEGWSNWPRIERMLLAAAGEIAPFDARKEDVPTTPVVSDVTIRQTLFSIEIDVTPRGTQRRSVTRFVKPEWPKPAAPRLTYVYDQQDSQPVSPTDVSVHLGAGCLVFDRHDGTLRGEYWTQRSRDKGLNTAGTIVMRRRVKP